MSTASIERIRLVDRTLRRILAPILFLLAGIFVVPSAAVAATSLIEGKRAAFLAASIFLAMGATTGWLGWLIWTGRRIPGWFVFGLYAATCTIATLGLLSQRPWFEGAAFALVTAPWLPAVWAAACPRPTPRRSPPRAKPKTKPTPFDDFA